MWYFDEKGQLPLENIFKWISRDLQDLTSNILISCWLIRFEPQGGGKAGSESIFLVSPSIYWMQLSLISRMLFHKKERKRKTRVRITMFTGSTVAFTYSRLTLGLTSRHRFCHVSFPFIMSNIASHLFKLLFIVTSSVSLSIFSPLQTYNFNFLLILFILSRDCYFALQAAALAVRYCPDGTAPEPNPIPWNLTISETFEASTRRDSLYSCTVQ